MIRLTLPEKPVELSPDVEAALIVEFKTSQKAVWHEPFIRNPLLEMTARKCAYCERQLGEGVNVTLDHYVHKDFAPERVVDWDNLLPCCQNCNSNKGTYNVLTEPFFSPVNNSIQNHLEITAGAMFKGISKEGKALVGRLRLNDSDQKAPPRFRLIQEITSFLSECDELCEELELENTSHKRTKLRNKIGALLNMTKQESQFSAVAATVLLHDPDFEKAKNCLMRLNDWQQRFDQLLIHAQEIALIYQVKRAN